MGKCLSCRKGFNGRNGNGYMPCNCKTKSKIDNTDLNNLLQKAIEAKPEFVEPPPLIPIGRPRLGWKPKPFNPDPYANFNKFLLMMVMICLAVMCFVLGCLYATSHIS